MGVSGGNQKRIMPSQALVTIRCSNESAHVRGRCLISSDPIPSAGTRDSAEKVQEEILLAVMGQEELIVTQVRLSALG